LQKKKNSACANFAPAFLLTLLIGLHPING
jgi:hypothetical protein